MRFKKLFPAAVTALVAALLVTPAQAQETIARSYSIVPKEGMAAQFEAAFKAHIQWRVENGDPWTWGVSTLETGEGLGEYSVRSGGHTWADLDAYDAEFGPQGLQHYTATVAPLVESVSSTITTVNEEISNRPPADRSLAFLAITTFHIRPDRQAQFNQALVTANQLLKDHDWPFYWVWAAPVSGGGMGPTMSVVVLHTSWADMQEPETPLMVVLAQAMGQSDFEEWQTLFGESIRGQETITRRLRPDLGSNAN